MARIEALAAPAAWPRCGSIPTRPSTADLAFYQKLGYVMEREEPIKAGGTLVHFVKTVKKP